MDNLLHCGKNAVKIRKGVGILCKSFIWSLYMKWTTAELKHMQAWWNWETAHLTGDFRSYLRLLWDGLNKKNSIRADSRFAPSQWGMALLCNNVSHWLDASLESALSMVLACSTHWKRYMHAYVFWIKYVRYFLTRTTKNNVLSKQYFTITFRKHVGSKLTSASRQLKQGFLE